MSEYVPELSSSFDNNTKSITNPYMLISMCNDEVETDPHNLLIVTTNYSIETNWTLADVCSGGATPGRASCSNDLAGRSTALAQALAPPCVLLCFGNSVRRKFKCYHIWPLYLFYFDGETALAACVSRATTKKGHQLFWGKKCSRVTWLEDFLTTKWPGSFTALAPPLEIRI